MPEASRYLSSQRFCVDAENFLPRSSPEKSNCQWTTSQAARECEAANGPHMSARSHVVGQAVWLLSRVQGKRPSPVMDLGHVWFAANCATLCLRSGNDVAHPPALLPDQRGLQLLQLHRLPQPRDLLPSDFPTFVVLC